MPVSTTNAISGPLLTNGLTTTFPFTFTAPSAAEVQVVSRDIATGVDTIVSPSLYSVTLTSGGGGSVVFAVAPATGAELYLLLNPNFTQDIEIANGAKINASDLNRMADRSAARDQFLKGRIDRSILSPVGTTPPTFTGLDGASEGDLLQVTGPNEFGPVPLASSSLQVKVNEAEAFAQMAAALSGPLYVSTAGGLAATVDGQEFAVDTGDGNADIYINDSGVAVFQRTIILAPSSGGAAAELGIQRPEAGAVVRRIAAVAQETVMSVKDFGAVGDNATDDTAAIEAALAAAKLVGGRLVFPAGIYLHSGLAEADLRFVTIEGVARGSFGTAGAKGVRLVCTAPAVDHLLLSNPHGVTVKDIQFETHSTVTPVSGAVISLFGSNGGSASCEVEQVRIEKHFNGILIDGVSNSGIEKSQVREGLGDFCVRLIGSAKRLDQIRLKAIITDSEVSGGSTTQDGFQIDTDVHTVFVEDCSALKARYGFNLNGAIAPEFVYFDNAEAETCSSHGFLIDKADHLRLMGGYSSVNNGNGYVFGAGFNSTAYLLAPDARGNVGHGMLLNGSGGVEIIAPRFGGNSVGTPGNNHGLVVGAGVSRWSVIGGRIGGNVNLQGTGAQGYGIFVSAGGSDDYRIIGVDVQGNSTGGLIDGGTGTDKRIRDNLGAADYGTARGAATVLSGATTGVFAHGLGATPARVQVTPRGDPGSRFWATANSTQVIVNLQTAPGGNVTFDVEAVL